ncbi:MAG: CinA family protein [Candidatus Thermoplasmatota archaeon]
MIDENTLKKIARVLSEKRFSIATAESCTGGLIAHTLTNVPGSSNYFNRGVVAYSNQSKIELLDVPEETLSIYGAVSEETAKAMAIGVRLKSKVNIGLATTGIAGPTGGSKEKPVGLVYISISTIKDTISKKCLFKGDRLSIKEQTCNTALNMLLEELKKM